MGTCEFRIICREVSRVGWWDGGMDAIIDKLMVRFTYLSSRQII